MFATKPFVFIFLKIPVAYDLINNAMGKEKTKTEKKKRRFPDSNIKKISRVSMLCKNQIQCLTADVLGVTGLCELSR